MSSSLGAVFNRLAGKTAVVTVRIDAWFTLPRTLLIQ
jgi:hypothetical protein